MSSRAIPCLLLLAIPLLAPATPSHALGFEEVPQPGDLEPAPPARETYRAGVSVQMVFPLGGASRELDHSLGWRAEILRWLLPGLGLTASLAHVVPAKDAVLPGDVALGLHSLGIGVHREWKLSAGRSVFGECSGIVAVKSVAYGGRSTTEAGLGASLTAGASTRVAPGIYAVLRVGYAAAQHRMAAVEFGFSVGF